MQDTGDPEPASQALFGVPTRPPSDDPPQIPGFEILRRIGRGGQADVWLAHQRKPLNRRVAIKSFSARDSADDVVRRFQAEREALSRLPSSGFCPIYEAGVSSDGRPYLVLEYVGGPNLLAAASSPEASPVLVLSLLEQVARALAVAHRMGIVHLDLKPGNILVSAWPDMACEPRIIDFGLARDAGSRTPTSGTPGYAAPELVSGAAASPLSDIFSLGRIIHAVLDACPVLAQSRCASALRRLAESCCATDPAARPQSAEEIAQRIHELRVPPVRARRRFVGAAMASIAAIGLGLVLVRGGAGSEIQRSRTVGDFRCIDLSPHYNASSSQLREGHNLPAGLQTLGGIPLLFADAPGQAGGSRLCALSGAIGGRGSADGESGSSDPAGRGSVDERRFTIPTDVSSATECVLVLNTLWGSAGQELIDIEFLSRDHTQRVTLRHGRDVRDYLRGRLVERGRATPAVKFGPEHELDVVTVELDPQFATGGLKSITLVDRGKNGVSRALLFAASVRVGGGNGSSEVQRP
jgi:hypothetical protein